jgi:hypothetical protein
MAVDLEYLRQHYASLSDEGLLTIARADLVPAAQECYDEELRQRELLSPRGARRKDGRRPELAGGNAEGDYMPPDAMDQPEWLDGSAEVFSRADRAGTTPAPDVEDAREALESAGIPCYLDVSDIPEEKNLSPPPTRLWRLKVPGELGLHAMSVLERDIFNPDFEAEWKTYLETLSDEQLPALTPEVSLCGLFDRVERVTKAYEDEIARRGLKSDSA